MTTYPLDRAGREAARQQIREDLARDAAARAEEQGRSWKCAEGIRHRGVEFDGCRNDGTGCLCWCHDPEDGAA